MVFCLVGVSVSSANLTCDGAGTQQLINKSDVVVVAKIIEVGPAPEVWSGLLLFVQRVRFEVKDVLKGRVNKHEIYVAHYVVKNSISADSKQPKLSPEIFKKGNTLLLFLNVDPGKGKYVDLATSANNHNDFVVFDANCGAILADQNALNDVERLLRR